MMANAIPCKSACDWLGARHGARHGEKDTSLKSKASSLFSVHEGLHGRARVWAHTAHLGHQFKGHLRKHCLTILFISLRLALGGCSLAPLELLLEVGVENTLTYNIYRENTYMYLYTYTYTYMYVYRYIGKTLYGTVYTVRAVAVSGEGGKGGGEGGVLIYIHS